MVFFECSLQNIFFFRFYQQQNELSDEIKASPAQDIDTYLAPSIQQMIDLHEKMA